MNNSIGHAVVGVFMDWLLCQGEQLRVKWDAISIPWSWNEQLNLVFCELRGDKEIRDGPYDLCHFGNQHLENH